MVRPADYPPPFDPSDWVDQPDPSGRDQIEVGVAIVGAGPAGLACAIRLGQLLEDHPDVARSLGEVPVVVVEKGRQAGSHLLSGAVLNPVSLRTLLGGTLPAEVPTFGPVPGEQVYVLTGRHGVAIPTPPPMRNHGHLIVSLSRLGRWLAARAEAGGAMVLAETAATTLLARDGRVVGVRSGDRGRGATGEPLANFEPGSDIVAQMTVLAEGSQGHLTGVALDLFGLRPPVPQTWELGVKEVWRVTRPLGQVIHTMGWPLRSAARYREFGGSFIYPMGPQHAAIGMVVGLDYRDASLSVHDLLQQLKTHPLIRPLLAGGERLEWGARTIPSGGYLSLPVRLHAPGLLLCGDGAGLVNIPTLKGIHYAIESGRLAAEAVFAALLHPEGQAVARLRYDQAVRGGFIGRDLHQSRHIRRAFGRGFFPGAAAAGLMTVTQGRLSLGALAGEADTDQPILRTDRAGTYPAPDGRLTFDKLSSVFAAGNQTRDDQPNHIRLVERVPADLADMWVHLCPAQVYTATPAGADGMCTVRVAASNCVHCGAISAKGGRLTPPEGGSGPEYSVT
jgi:electron-transferring-flavoprotein dehydrogenase